MSQLTKKMAQNTHSVDINCHTGNEMGQKPMLDMYSNTTSMDSGVKNDVSMGNSPGAPSGVKRDVNSNTSSPSSEIKNLVKKSGKGKGKGNISSAIYGS